MTVHSYQYATTTQRGIELGIIKCEDIEPFVRFDDALARKHRPNDERVVIWNGVGMWGPEGLIVLFRPLVDLSSLVWNDYTFTVQDN